MTKKIINQIFVDSDGNYLGEFSYQNSAIPKEAVEVFILPQHGKDIYNFQTNTWISKTKNIVDKKEELRNQLISSRRFYLNKTLEKAFEYYEDGLEYPDKAKRTQAKQEIKDIEAATTITALNRFNAKFE